MFEIGGMWQAGVLLLLAIVAAALLARARIETGPSKPTLATSNEETVDSSTADLLIRRSQDFRDRIDPLRIREQLRSSLLSDRRDSALFTVYHLLVSAAVAEQNITSYLTGTDLPGEIKSQLNWFDEIALTEAWAGKSFENSRNLIGAIAFSIAILFFLEGFAKLVFGEDRIRADLMLRESQMLGLARVVGWLESHTRIEPSKLHTVQFMNRFRNGWHSFGHYEGPRVECKGIRLIPDERLPLIPEPVRNEMLSDLLDVFLEIDDLREERSN